VRCKRSILSHVKRKKRRKNSGKHGVHTRITCPYTPPGYTLYTPLLLSTRVHGHGGAAKTTLPPWKRCRVRDGAPYLRYDRL